MVVLDMRMDNQKQPRENERRQRYARLTALRLRAASDCQFSLLPAPELARIAVLWYDAASEAMFQGHCSSIDKLIRKQAFLAAEEGFTLDDLLQLLRLCRRIAIESCGWTQDAVGHMDEMIDDVLNSLRNQVAWDIPEGLSYLAGEGSGEWGDEQREQEEREDVATEPRGERRMHFRNKLRLPIRVCGQLTGGPREEITRTENVAKGGVYFFSDEPYFRGMRVEVVYPYWDMPGEIHREYPAEVVRIDERKGRNGIALKFLVSLDSPPSANITVSQ